MIGGIALAAMEVYWLAIGCSAAGWTAYGSPFAALRHLLWLKALAILLAGLGVVQRERGAGLAPAVSIEQPILRLGGDGHTRYARFRCFCIQCAG